jgi:hypothetical protein
MMVNMTAPPPASIYLGGRFASACLTTCCANSSVGMERSPWLAFIRKIMFFRYPPYKESGDRLKTDAWLEAMLDFTEAAETSITSMFSGLHSMYKISVMECSAALEAQYMPFQGVGLGDR